MKKNIIIRSLLYF